MKNKYEETITAFEQQLQELMLAFRLLKKKNSELEIELERKHNDLMQAHQNVLTLRKEYEQLRIAQNLASNENEKKEAKQSITKLIREIDKCLALLND